MVTAGDLTVLPAVGSSATRRDLAVLCGGAIAALTAVVEVGAVVQAHLDRTSDDGDFAVFPGWQVDAVEIAGMVLALALLVTSAIAVRRIFRRLEGRTPYRRVAILIALLPGLALGLAARAGTRSALDTASEHTAAAAAAEAEFGGVFSTKHPPYAPVGSGIAAPPEMAARMLAPAGLGAGWYALTATNPSMVSLPEGDPAQRFGGAVIVKSIVEQAKLVGKAWIGGPVVLERMIQFPTAGAAASFLDEQRGRAAPPCMTCPRKVPTWTAARIDGVRVLETVNPGTNRTAIFVAGNMEFTVVMPSVIPAAVETAIVNASVRRAK